MPPFGAKTEIKEKQQNIHYATPDEFRRVEEKKQEFPQFIVKKFIAMIRRKNLIYFKYIIL